MGRQDSPVRVAEAEYKGERAVEMESAALRVAIIPDWGGKTASLIHKKTGRVYLDQLPGMQFRKATYGAPYDSGEASGFNDMFPTISECYCDVDPWAGTKMPDHGEVWSLPWKCEVSGAEVRLSVHGVRFPYVLSKRISFEGENTILMSYRARNLSAYEFPAMWAAHPLFSVTPGTRIILPESVRNIINTVPGPALGGYGGRFNFPTARTAEGREWDLSRVGPKDGKYYFKYFFLDNLQEGFALIHDPQNREAVGLVWPVEQVPYLGMWVNEGAWAGMYDVAPEPCTAPFDRWDTARQWGKLPVIPPFGSQEWSLRTTVGLVDNPRRVEADGTIN